MRKQLMGAAVAAVMIAPAMAADAVGNNKWYLNAGVGYHLFDGLWDLDSEAAAVLSVERRLENNWGVEVSGTYAEADNSFGNTAGDAEVSFFSVNGIRYFPVANDKLEPYAAAGLGMGIFNPDVVREEEITQGNVGGGVRYALSGPLALAMSEDPAAAAKALHDFAKDNEALKITAGAMGGKLLSDAEIVALAKLPTRDELLGKLAGTMQAPIQKFVQTLNEVPGSFVRVLAAVRDQKQAA